MSDLLLSPREQSLELPLPLLKIYHIFIPKILNCLFEKTFGNHVQRNRVKYQEKKIVMREVKN